MIQNSCVGCRQQWRSNTILAHDDHGAYHNHSLNRSTALTLSCLIGTLLSKTQILLIWTFYPTIKADNKISNGDVESKQFNWTEMRLISKWRQSRHLFRFGRLGCRVEQSQAVSQFAESGEVRWHVFFFLNRRKLKRLCSLPWWWLAHRMMRIGTVYKYIDQILRTS